MEKKTKKVLGIEHLNDKEVVDLIDYLYETMNGLEKHILKCRIKKYLHLREKEQKYKTL